MLLKRKLLFDVLICIFAGTWFIAYGSLGYEEFGATAKGMEVIP